MLKLLISHDASGTLFNKCMSLGAVINQSSLCRRREPAIKCVKSSRNGLLIWIVCGYDSHSKCRNINNKMYTLNRIMKLLLGLLKQVQESVMWQLTTGNYLNNYKYSFWNYAPSREIIFETWTYSSCKLKRCLITWFWRAQTIKDAFVTKSLNVALLSSYHRNFITT